MVAVGGLFEGGGLLEIFVLWWGLFEGDGLFRGGGGANSRIYGIGAVVLCSMTEMRRAHCNLPYKHDVSRSFLSR